MALITIYEQIVKRYNSRKVFRPDTTEQCPSTNPHTWQEADEIIAREIAYHGLLIKPPHFPIQHLNGIIGKLYWRVFAPRNKQINFHNSWCCNITNADVRFKNIMRQLHNFRQRYWYWEPFNLMCDYSCYECY